MRWRTEIARLKDLPSGSAVGYGMTFHTSRPSRIATLPVGYADGYSRLHSNNGEVLVRGKRAPVVGRVSMDLVTIDVTDLDARFGDEVVLLGSQGKERITPEELHRLYPEWDLQVVANPRDAVHRSASNAEAGEFARPLGPIVAHWLLLLMPWVQDSPVLASAAVL